MNHHYNDEYECELLKPYSGLDKPINHGKIELLTKPGHPYPLLSFLDGDKLKTMRYVCVPMHIPCLVTIRFVSVTAACM